MLVRNRQADTENPCWKVWQEHKIIWQSISARQGFSYLEEGQVCQIELMSREDTDVLGCSDGNGTD